MVDRRRRLEGKAAVRQAGAYLAGAAELPRRLVQWDTSIHDWLEGRRKQVVKLVAMIDDATSELFARFVLEDSTEQHMRVLRAYLECNGRPLAFYTDKAGLFHVSPRQIDYDGRMSAAGETQIGRALRELGIELILAHSPQAKGRIERSFGTMQDRLIKGLRIGKACTVDAANEYLDRCFCPCGTGASGRMQRAR